MDVSDLADAHADQLWDDDQEHLEKAREMAIAAMTDHRLMLTLMECASAHEDDTMDWIGREYCEAVAKNTLPTLQAKLYDTVEQWAIEHYDEVIKLRGGEL